MSAAAVAGAIVARRAGFVKFLGRALGVNPGIQLLTVKGLALPTDRNFVQERAHFLVEHGATHG